MDKLLSQIQNIGPERLIWATDLDLTVLDTHLDPHNIQAEPGLEDACNRIDVLTQGRFFIITGRELDYVDRIFPQSRFKTSAEYHNMVRWNSNGVIVEPNTRPKWELVDEGLKALLKEYPGLKFRVKPFMRSMHYMHADCLKDSANKENALRRIQTLLDFHEASTGQKLENIDGGVVFDIAPFGSSKGSAIEEILSLCNARERGLVPIYFGDSPGDLPAALKVRENGGIFVAVGDDPRLDAVADFRLENPAECRKLIQIVSGWNAVLKPKGPEAP